MRALSRYVVAVAILFANPVTVLAAQEAHEESGGGGLFSPSLGLGVWTVIVFLTLLYVLRKWAWRPILAALEARERGIQASLDEAARIRDEAAELLEEHRRQLGDARRHAQDIVAESRQAAEQVRRDVEAKTRKESEAILEGARREIQRETEKAMQTLRRESVDLALAATGRLLKRKLDGEADRELISDYLDELGRSKEADA
jgi:F-type H+-transporting ATPase subunit b